MKNETAKNNITSSIIDRPLVSIITVCLNSEKYLENTIESIIRQTYDNIEYIVIDGGSKDNTIEIIKRYSDKISIWKSEPDNGIYDAMNKGISLSKGKIIGIINSDDWYDSEAVKKVVDASLKDLNADIFYGDLMYVVQTKRKVFDYKLKPNLNLIKRQMSIYHPSCFIRKKIYNMWKYDLKFNLTADYDFLLKLFLYGTKFHYINSVLTYHRAGGKSKSYMRCVENFRIWNQYFGKWRALYLYLKETKYYLKTLFFKDDFEYKLFSFYKTKLKGKHV